MENKSFDTWLEETKKLNLNTQDLYKLLKKSSIDYIVKLTNSPNYTGSDAYMARTWSLQEMWDRPTLERKPIRLLIADGTRSDEYVEFLNRRFDVTVVKNGEECDLVLFTGGEDVNPKYYNQSKGNQTYFSDKRDKLEMEVYNTYRHVPHLGICRGNQFLTVMNGGSLVQHLDGHGMSHDIIFRNQQVFTVTSTHHQMAYPFDLPSSIYKIIGYSKNFKSGTYLNGDNKEIDIPKDFVEVEIIKYKNTLGIQGHPEYYNASKEFVNTSLQLIYELIFETEKFNKEITKEKLEIYEQI